MSEETLSDKSLVIEGVKSFWKEDVKEFIKNNDDLEIDLLCKVSGLVEKHTKKDIGWEIQDLFQDYRNKRDKLAGEELL